MLTTKRRTLPVTIRWLIRRDMPEVLQIENACFEFAWTEEDFLTCLRQRNCIGYVVEHNHEIVGFMIYEQHKVRLRILNFAVAPRAQGLGVGTQMMQRLKDKLSQERCKQIIADVRETNLYAHLFFRAMGFRCVNVLRGHYEDTTEDALEFLYQTESEG